jgi:hypothetical protein
MAKKRKALAARDGQRFRVLATVGRFGTRKGYGGDDEPTILLRDLCCAATGAALCDHLWFRVGKWADGLAAGDRIAFDARVTTYEKGYRGWREDKIIEAPLPSTDWRLERPTKVKKIESARPECGENVAHAVGVEA